jgi:hypothetical protein
MQTTDCQDGLVCVTHKNNVPTCSSNLADIVSTEEAGAPARDGGGKDGGDAAVRDGAGQDVTTQTDAGSPPEGGAAPEASGDAPVDEPPPDAAE